MIVYREFKNFDYYKARVYLLIAVIYGLFISLIFYYFIFEPSDLSDYYFYLWVLSLLIVFILLIATKKTEVCFSNDEFIIKYSNYFFLNKRDKRYKIKIPILKIKEKKLVNIFGFKFLLLLVEKENGDKDFVFDMQGFSKEQINVIIALLHQAVI